MSNAANNPVVVDFEEIVIGTYKDLNYDKLIPRECGVLATYWEDMQLCSSKEALEVGYGDGAIATYLLEHGYHVTALDSDQRVEKMFLENLGRRGIEPSSIINRVADIQDYVIEENKYAVIVISYVLHFLDGPLALDILNRLKRSLAPNGVLLLRVHHADFWETAKDESRFKHFFTEQELDLCFKEGFDILHAAKLRYMTSTSQNRLFSKVRQEKGLTWERDTYTYVSLEYLAQKR